VDGVISLDLQRYVGAEQPRDHVYVDGAPPVDMTVKGGIAGDHATAAIVVNSIPKLMAARPGVVTVKDLPLVHRFSLAEVKALPPKKK
jgi:4-hydroxy-tetrahydrodipicolinate reductase